MAVHNTEHNDIHTLARRHVEIQMRAILQLPTQIPKRQCGRVCREFSSQPSFSGQILPADQLVHLIKVFVLRIPNIRESTQQVALAGSTISQKNNLDISQ